MVTSHSALADIVREPRMVFLRDLNILAVATQD